MKTIKVVVIGDSGSGKTSIVMRRAEGLYNPRFVTTIGIDMRPIITGEKKIYLWDTAGQERFRSIGRNFYRGSKAILVVFDLHNPESTDSLEYWFESINSVCDDSTVKVLVGAKKDLERIVPEGIGEEFAQRYGAKYFECSSKRDEGIDEIFQFIFDSVPDEESEPVAVDSLRSRYCCV